MRTFCLHSAITALPTLTIRNVPDALHQRLKARAKAHRRSLNAEALMMLDEALPTPGPAPPATQDDALALIDALRARTPYRAAPGEIEQIIREGRDSGDGRDSR